jgi:hypothetical protein
MKLPLLRLLKPLLLLSFACSAFATDVPIPTADRGLLVQLRASAYEVRLIPSSTIRPRLTAHALVANRSRTSATFLFTSAYAAEQLFRFRLLDSTGQQLWASDQNVRVIPGETPRTLALRGIWRAAIEVPLEVDGALLKAGNYTIEARLDAQPRVSSQVAFRVIDTEQPPPATEKPLVYSVETVSARMIPTFAPPPEVRVQATGTVTTGGWSAPELRLRQNPEPGYLEFDFVAQPPPPDAVVIQALQPVSASAQVPVPPVFRGIRVHARVNAKAIPAP